MKVIIGVLQYQLGFVEGIIGVDECQVTRVLHTLRAPGCVPKLIASYACTGRCSSYLQVILNHLFNLS